MGKDSMGFAHLHRGGARGRGWGVTGAGRGDVCTPGGGSGSLMEWPGVRTPRMVRETQSGGPGLRRLGIWPFWGHWAGRQGGPDRGPLGRGVEAPRPPRGRRKGPARSPGAGAGCAAGRRAGASPRLRGPREDAGQRGQRRGRLAGALESVDEDAGHQRSLQGGRRRAGPAVQIQRGAGIQVGN